MTRIEPPDFGLARYGRDWVPPIHFTRSLARDEFVRLADRLCDELGGEVVERYGGEGEDAKEYRTIRVGEARWMLCRCYYPVGISLDSDSPADLPKFETIARSVNARPVGWRYRWALLLRRLRGEPD